MFKHYAPVFLFLLILPVIVLVAVYFLCDTQLFISQVIMSICTGLIASFVLYIFVDGKLRSIKHELLGMTETITLVLEDKLNDRTYELPAKIYRKDYSRSEILGVLGMIPVKQKGTRFNLNYTSSFEFMNKIQDIYNRPGNHTLVIECEAGELDQFDLSGLAK